MHKYDDIRVSNVSLGIAYARKLGRRNSIVVIVFLFLIRQDCKRQRSLLDVTHLPIAPCVPAAAPLRLRRAQRLVLPPESFASTGTSPQWQRRRSRRRQDIYSPSASASWPRLKRRSSSLLIARGCK